MQSTGSTLIVGFLGKKQYAANAPSRLTMKLSKHLCLECSTWAMFLSSSFIVSMMALFLSSTLSDTDIMAPFMLFLSLVISCMPSTNSFSKRFLPIYPLSPTSLPYIRSTKALYSSRFLSPTSSGVIMKFISTPFSLHIKCSLNPKNHPIEHLPLWALKVYFAIKAS